jgi:DNA-binding MarR family transcriptional regulator
MTIQHKSNSELNIVKAIIRAKLTKVELDILLFLMKETDKTVIKNKTDMAKTLGLQRPNFVKSLNNMIVANVIGERSNGLYIKAVSSWGK